MVDHDRLFKELLSTFFLDFLALVAPLLWQEVEPESVEFLEKELYTDVVAGERHEVDLLVKLRRRGVESFVLVHVENQATAEAAFEGRMFRYFARIEARHGLNVYPVAVFSYSSPRGRQRSVYRMGVAGLHVLRFQFHAVQLNRLRWRAFLRHPNPVAAALMSRMRIPKRERPRAKLECLRMLATLRLDPARTSLISGFVDTYLKLRPDEKRLFASELETVPDQEKGDVMEIVTSWMEEGIEKGRQEERRASIARLLGQLIRRCGSLSADVTERIATLPAEALDRLANDLLDFSTIGDLERWLEIERDEQTKDATGLTTSWKEEGREEERRQGSAHTLVLFLGSRCGPLPEALSTRIAALPMDALDRLADVAWDLPTHNEVEQWLAKQGF